MNALERIGWWTCLIGILSAGTARPATRYVNVSNAAPAAPYTSWATAAQVINMAISEAESGDEIIVAPGVYLQAGGGVYIPHEKTLLLSSLVRWAAVIDANGTEPALIVSGTNSVVDGFTIRNGTASSGGGADMNNHSTLRNCLVTGNRGSTGGGVALAHQSVADHCLIQSNLATYAGGGVAILSSSGTVQRCVVVDNVSSNLGGGAYAGGAGTISNCWIAGNAATYSGGGLRLEGGEAVNVVVVDNDAGNNGGGISTTAVVDEQPAVVRHCTVVSNRAVVQAGGAWSAYSRLFNNVVYFNSAPSDPDLLAGSNLAISNCCVNPSPGPSNFTNAPAFVDFAGRDFRLQTASFCIDAGLSAEAPGDDLDDRARPLAGTPGGAALPDVGAFEYEFRIAGIVSVAGLALDVVWDEQDAGLYRLDASVPGLVQPAWSNVAVYTNPGMAAGQFGVHTQRLAIAGPAHAVFRLRIDRAP